MGEKQVQRKVNQDCYAVIVATLLKGPSDQYTLASITGLRVTTVRELLKAFHEHRAVHIVGWIPNGRDIDTTPIYAIGDGEDAPRRPPKTSKQSSSDHRARRKKAERDPFDQLLFGSASKKR